MKVSRIYTLDIDFLRAVPGSNKNFVDIGCSVTRDGVLFREQNANNIIPSAVRLGVPVLMSSVIFVINFYQNLCKKRN